MSTLGLTHCLLLQKSFRIFVSNQNHPVHAETVGFVVRTVGTDGHMQYRK